MVEVDGTRFGFRGRALWLPAADALVVADCHAGRAATSAVEFPLGERADLRDRLAALVAAHDPATVAFAGDVLHPFADVPPRARETIDDLLAACRDADARPVLVAGNHDAALADVVDVPVHDAHPLSDGTLVCHGHERPEVDAPRYVIGHDHPTVEIEGQRHPCLLYGSGTYEGADLFVLPAFSRLAPGVPVGGMRTGEFASPLITDADALRPVVALPDSDPGCADDPSDPAEALVFPPLGRLRDHLE